MDFLKTMKRVKKIFKHPLFSGSAVMIGGSLVVNGFNYLYHLIMGRILGPSSYGVLAAIFSVLYIVSVLPMSTSFAIVKFVSSAKGKKERIEIYRAIRKLITNIAIAISVIMLALSFPIAKFLHIKEAISVSFVSIIVFFSLKTLVNQAASQGILKFTGVVVPNMVSSLLKLVLGVLFVVLGFSVGGAVFGVVLGAIFAFFVSLRYVKGFNGKKKVKEYDTKPFLKYAFPVLVQALAFTSIFTVDLILVKHFLPAFEAGLYAALSTLGKIVYFAAQPITVVMFPIVSKRRSKGEKYRQVFYLSFLGTIGLSLAVVLFYYLFPNLAIGVLYGSEYLSAAKELVWMGIFIGIYTICYNLTNFLLSIDRTKIVLLPLVATILQIIGIWYFHESILQVIQVSLGAMTLLLAGLSMYLGYNQLSKLYEKRKK